MKNIVLKNWEEPSCPTMYKYYSYDDSLNIKRLSGEIYFNSPDRFNDLFDAQHDIINNINDVKIEDVKNRLKEIGYSDYENKATLLQGNDNNQLVKEIRKKQIENVGITCFTDSPENVLMWAYYGENKGYCIEYDMNVIKNNIAEMLQNEYSKKMIEADANKRIMAKKVKYRKSIDLPKAPLFFDNNKDDESQPYSKYFYKLKDWNREKEYRIALSLLPRQSLKFDNAVKSITIGYYMDDSNILSLLGIIAQQNNDIKVYFLSKDNEALKRKEFRFNKREEFSELLKRIKEFRGN